MWQSVLSVYDPSRLTSTRLRVKWNLLGGGMMPWNVPKKQDIGNEMFLKHDNRGF